MKFGINFTSVVVRMAKIARGEVKGNFTGFCCFHGSIKNAVKFHLNLTVASIHFDTYSYSWLSEAKPQSCHENLDLRYIYVYIVRETRPQAPVITLLTSAIFLNFFFFEKL